MSDAQDQNAWFFIDRRWAGHATPLPTALIHRLGRIGPPARQALFLSLLRRFHPETGSVVVSVRELAAAVFPVAEGLDEAGAKKAKENARGRVKQLLRGLEKGGWIVVTAQWHMREDGSRAGNAAPLIRRGPRLAEVLAEAGVYEVPDDGRTPYLLLGGLRLPAVAYTMIPNLVLDAGLRVLSPEELMVLLGVASHVHVSQVAQGTARLPWVSHARLASYLNISRRTIDNYAAKLREKGLKPRRRADAKGRASTNEWVLRPILDLIAAEAEKVVKKEQERRQASMVEVLDDVVGLVEDDAPAAPAPAEDEDEPEDARTHVRAEPWTAFWEDTWAETWAPGFEAHFPGLVVPKWGPKELGQLKILVDRYDYPVDLVRQALTYLIERWPEIHKRFFPKAKALSFPTVGFLLKFHDQLLPEAQQAGAGTPKGTLERELRDAEAAYRAWLAKNPYGDIVGPEATTLKERIAAAKKALEAVSSGADAQRELREAEAAYRAWLAKNPYGDIVGPEATALKKRIAAAKAAALAAA